MCGRYTSTAAFDELALRFGITVESGTNEELTARYNVAPSQAIPIITASDKGSAASDGQMGVPSRVGQ
jgi:putative SOS response-associated peptidase YedK